MMMMMISSIKKKFVSFYNYKNPFLNYFQKMNLQNNGYHSTENNVNDKKNILTLKTINQKVIKAEYAIRGKISIEFDRLSSIHASDPSQLPFYHLTACNIGNPQFLGQPPITYHRQVSALLEMPWLIQEDKKLSDSDTALVNLFPKDVVDRAKNIQNSFSPVGAYSNSQGQMVVRKHIAEFIERRDGFPSDPNHIFLTSGASSAISMSLQLIIQHPKAGILIPRPQYPLYSATITLSGGMPIYYDLEEEQGWSLNISQLQEILATSRKDGIDVIAIVIINPGNPTGSILSKKNLEDIAHFCSFERLILLADEVYQENVYYPEEKPFISAKHVVRSLGLNVELFSFHSISKGLLGECGRRGGYLECANIDVDVVAQLYKLATINLCSNTLGQIMLDLMVLPPQPDQLSYASYRKEMDSIYESLKRRSKMLVDTLRQLEGVSCQLPEGAMYVFPSYSFSRKFLDECSKEGNPPDFVYALKLLHATGICGVHGTGFGQKRGTHHIRFTFLPSEEHFPQFLQLLVRFHAEFCNSYR